MLRGSYVAFWRSASRAARLAPPESLNASYLAMQSLDESQLTEEPLFWRRRSFTPTCSPPTIRIRRHHNPNWPPESSGMVGPDLKFFEGFFACNHRACGHPVVMLIGSSRCGKTTLVRQFVDKERATCSRPAGDSANRRVPWIGTLSRSSFGLRVRIGFRDPPRIKVNRVQSCSHIHVVAQP